MDANAKHPFEALLHSSNTADTALNSYVAKAPGLLSALANLCSADPDTANNNGGQADVSLVHGHTWEAAVESARPQALQLLACVASAAPQGQPAAPKISPSNQSCRFSLLH
eukprot:scaffold287907_cov31-Prasinocladus_malaysianus.AAC.1